MRHIFKTLPILKTPKIKRFTVCKIQVTVEIIFHFSMEYVPVMQWCDEVEVSEGFIMSTYAEERVIFSIWVCE